MLSDGAAACTTEALGTSDVLTRLRCELVPHPAHSDPPDAAMSAQVDAIFEETFGLTIPIEAVWDLQCIDVSADTGIWHAPSTRPSACAQATPPAAAAIVHARKARSAKREARSAPRARGAQSAASHLAPAAPTLDAGTWRRFAGRS